jgi:hypothetical protein
MEINSSVGVRFVPARDRRRFPRVRLAGVSAVVYVRDKSAVSTDAVEALMIEVEATRAKLAALTTRLEHEIAQIGRDGCIEHD